MSFSISPLDGVPLSSVLALLAFSIMQCLAYRRAASIRHFLFCHYAGCNGQGQIHPFVVRHVGEGDLVYVLDGV